MNRPVTGRERRAQQLRNTGTSECAGVQNLAGSGSMGPMADTTIPTDTELRERLTKLQYDVTQKAGTERAFSGAYHDTKDPGVYHCIVCDAALFSSGTKFDSGSGWPSFYEAMDPELVTMNQDRSHGMVRTEAVCANCGSHLGHVFPDGPNPTGDRFCMNSASLNLKSEDEASDTAD
jgi:peptide-methionine (R)-S-oxide reductase